MRIGCDLVDLDRFQHSVSNERFVERVFHPDEVIYCRSKAHPHHSFAARFAAKEAFSKALGTGIFSEGLYPQDIVVCLEPSGRPYFRLAPPAQKILESHGFSKTDLSMSHHGTYAMAVVLLMP